MLDRAKVSRVEEGEWDFCTGRSRTMFTTMKEEEEEEKGLFKADAFVRVDHGHRILMHPKFAVAR